jgi:crossover junction endodeoxyribonuclease RusA
MTDIGGIAAERLTVRLPYPPSVNSLFTNVPGRGRVPVARYQTWRKAAQNEITSQRAGWSVKSISGPVRVTIIAGKPDRRRRDIDNICKAPLDTLVSMGLIDDDSAIQSLTVSWGDVSGALVEITAI